MVFLFIEQDNEELTGTWREKQFDLCEHTSSKRVVHMCSSALWVKTRWNMNEKSAIVYSHVVPDLRDYFFCGTQKVKFLHVFLQIFFII